MGGIRRRVRRSRRVRLVAGLVVLLVVAAACEAVPGDFNADGKADQVYVTWTGGTSDPAPVFVQPGQTTPLYTGEAGDIPVAGDYNGDLRWEPAVLRGTTWISSAEANPIDFDPVGMPAGPAATPAGRPTTPPTLLPVPGDYDGTGRTVPAYYDQVDATWWIMGRSGSTQFGIPPAAGGNQAYDVPVPGDYDGDGKTDIAVFRPSDGSFHYLSSKTGLEVVTTPTVPAGDPAVLPVPANYDGLGHVQAAVSEMSGLNWYVAGDPGTFASFPMPPAPGDEYLAAPADYAGSKATPTLFDGDTDAFWMAGQAEPPEHARTSQPDVAATVPWAVLVNYVRLTIYAVCRWSPSPPSYCPGVV
jgi:hypothetical protein